VMRCSAEPGRWLLGMQELLYNIGKQAASADFEGIRRPLSRL